MQTQKMPRSAMAWTVASGIRSLARCHLWALNWNFGIELNFTELVADRVGTTSLNCSTSAAAHRRPASAPPGQRGRRHDHLDQGLHGHGPGRAPPGQGRDQPCWQLVLAHRQAAAQLAERFGKAARDLAVQLSPALVGIKPAGHRFKRGNAGRDPGKAVHALFGIDPGAAVAQPGRPWPVRDSCAAPSR